MTLHRGMLGLALTTSAGWLDAVGFLRLPGVYVSFMSGNTTRAGIGIADGQWPVVLLCGSALALFFLGSFASGLTTGLPERWSLATILGVEAVLLGIAVFLSASTLQRRAVLVIPLAMGMQNGAIRQLHPGATTFVTGTLFGSGHELGRSIVGTRDAQWLRLLVIWLSFAGGALGGALANLHWGVMALAIPLMVVATCGSVVFVGAG